MPTICPCWDTPERCENCRAGLQAQLRGVAMIRGEVWADRVARAVGTARDWPDTEKARALAMRQVADVAGSDGKLISVLGELVFDGARKRWGMLRSDPSLAERSRPARSKRR